MNDYVPSEFYLGQNYPNPFRDKTTIKYCIPYKIKVRITVYDSNGEMIEKLVDELKDAGTYGVEFNGNDLSSGIYLYRLQAGKYVEVKQMVLMN